jgi:hypothetical protein
MYKLPLTAIGILAAILGSMPAVLARPSTTLTLFPSSGLVGGCSAVNFSGKLVRSDTNVAIANVVIELYVNEQRVGQTTTDSFGNYRFRYAYVEGLAPGRHSMRAKFAGNQFFRSTTITNTHTNGKGTPTLTVQSLGANVGQVVTLEARLTNCGRQGVADRRINFYFNGRYVDNPKTNAQGVARVTVRVRTPGKNVVKVEFSGDSYYHSVSNTGSVVAP